MSACISKPLWQGCCVQRDNAGCSEQNVCQTNLETQHQRSRGSLNACLHTYCVWGRPLWIVPTLANCQRGDFPVPLSRETASRHKCGCSLNAGHTIWIKKRPLAFTTAIVKMVESRSPGRDAEGCYGQHSENSRAGTWAGRLRAFLSSATRLYGPPRLPEGGAPKAPVGQGTENVRALIGDVAETPRRGRGRLITNQSLSLLVSRIVRKSSRHHSEPCSFPFFSFLYRRQFRFSSEASRVMPELFFGGSSLFWLSLSFLLLTP